MIRREKLDVKEQEINKITKDELKRAVEIFDIIGDVLHETIKCSDAKDWHLQYGFVPDDRRHVPYFKHLSVCLEGFVNLISEYNYDILTMILNLGDVQIDEKTGSIRDKYFNGYTDEELQFKTAFGYGSLALAAKFAKIFDHENEYEYNRRDFKNARFHYTHKTAVSFNDMVKGLGIDKSSINDEELYEALFEKIFEFQDEQNRKSLLNDNLRKKYEEMANKLA